ncbi:MAG TPA: hypothetical protein VNZ52_11270 [Candidatus Thermoplasmatota archaeon]|nr:hypothetical protein [Candidatus Thermoplasmatota archaeon]
MIAAAFLVPGAVFGAQYAYYEDAPTWKTGDSWTFRSVATVTVTSSSEEGTKTVTETEENFLTIRVLADNVTRHGHDVYEMGVFRNGEHVSTFYDSRASINTLVPKPADLRAGKRGDAVGYHEFPMFQWPLFPGKSWDYEAYDRRVHFSAGDRDFLTLADSTLATVSLEQRLGDYFTESDRQRAEEDGYHLEYTMRYWYSSAVGYPVRGEWDSVLRFRLDSREMTLPQVGTVRTPEMRFEVIVHEVSELVTATALGETADAVPYVEVGLQLPEAIDISKTDKAAFTATAPGGLPADAKIVWTIDGATYEGPTVEAAFKNMGLKPVRAEVFLGDRLAGAASGLYEVYWTGALEGTHGVQGEAASLAFTAAEGAYIASLSYHVNGALLTSSPENDVEIVGEDGDDYDLDDVEDGIELEEGEYQVIVNPGTAEYVNSAYALHVEVRYAGATKGGSSSEGGARSFTMLAPQAPRDFSQVLPRGADHLVARLLAEIGAPEGAAGLALR